MQSFNERSHGESGVKGRKEVRTGDFILAAHKRGLVNKVTFQLLNKHSDVCWDHVFSWPGYADDGQTKPESFSPEMHILVDRDTPCRHFQSGSGWEVMM